MDRAKCIRLSIVTPVFDTPADYLSALAACVSPLLAATASEWLIVDDASQREDTRAWLARAAGRPGLRLLRQAANRGVAAARNAGAAQAAGAYLVFVDADDLIVPAALASLLQTIERHPAIRWLAGEFEQFTDTPPPIDCRMTAADAARVVAVEHWPEVAPRLVFETLFNQGAYIIERRLFLDSGGFDRRFRIGEDWYLWMRLALRGELHHCALQVLWQRRGHASIMSGGLSSSAALVAPYRAAWRDARFRRLRRPLRWRIFHLYRLLAQRNRTLGRYLPTLRFSLLAAIWGINDPRQWLNVLRALGGASLR